jgi:DNA modification methylase
MVGWQGNGSHYHNKKLANLRDIWTLDFDTFQQQLDVWFQKRDNTAQYLHPTQKPVKLGVRALLKSSGEGGGVMDPFAGSGSIMIACEQLNRKCYMMELDPKFCDVIVKRYENYTGNKSEKISR